MKGTIVAAVIVAIAVLGASILDRYQVSAAASADGFIAFRINRLTGAVTLCTVGPGPQAVCR